MFKNAYTLHETEPLVLWINGVNTVESGSMYTLMMKKESLSELGCNTTRLAAVLFIGVIINTGST